MDNENDYCVLRSSQSLLDAAGKDSWLNKSLLLGCTCDQMFNESSSVFRRLNLSDRIACDSVEEGKSTGLWLTGVYLSILVFIVTFSLVGNGMIVWIITAHHRMRTVSNLYFLNLALADIALSLFNTIPSGLYNIFYNWPFGETACALNSFFDVVPTFASIFTLTVMSMDRYVGIVHPMVVKPGGRGTVYIIITIWLAAIACGAPALWSSKSIQEYSVVIASNKTEAAGLTLNRTAMVILSNVCNQEFTNQSWQKIYNAMLLTLQYLIPVAVLCFTYMRIKHTLNKVVAQPDGRGNVQSKKRASNMLAILFAAFLLMWLPYNMYFTFLKEFFYDWGVTFYTHRHLFLSCFFLGMAYTMVNPIVYPLMNVRFGVGFRWAFRWLPEWFLKPVKRAEYINVLYTSGAGTSGSMASAQTSIQIVSASRASVHRSSIQVQSLGFSHDIDKCNNNQGVVELNAWPADTKAPSADETRSGEEFTHNQELQRASVI